MKINDNRHLKQEISFPDLEAGKVYVSNRLQKYVMKAMDYPFIMCIETGETFSDEECDGDVFNPVNAVLEIS